MRYDLVTTDHAPPGGFSASVPETGGEWRGHSAFWGLVSDIARHLEANALDPATAEARVREHTASRMRSGGHTHWFRPVTTP